MEGAKWANVPRSRLRGAAPFFGGAAPMTTPKEVAHRGERPPAGNAHSPRCGRVAKAAIPLACAVARGQSPAEQPAHGKRAPGAIGAGGSCVDRGGSSRPREARSASGLRR